tara:strand:+ start:745 stop:1545 length:801 start_codon:yes stop_codon:yes gene_type:complete
MFKSAVKPDWTVIIAIALMHIGAVVSIFFFSWPSFFTTLGLLWLTGHIGITLGFHRLLTHRSFKTPKWFEYLVTIFGCLAWQGSPIRWVGLHRLHYKHSDEDEDPHTPNHGFFWAHMLWTLTKDEPSDKAYWAAQDLVKDPFHRWLNRYFWVPQFLLAVAFWFIGGWSLILWAICLRTTLVYHTTWLVNSATHTWGYKNYETGDRSTNLWWLALLTAGEGWHNNHHKFQTSAAHGLRWFELDTTYLTIKFLKLIGVASNVILPKKT